MLGRPLEEVDGLGEPANGLDQEMTLALAPTVAKQIKDVACGVSLAQVQGKPKGELQVLLVGEGEELGLLGSAQVEG